METIKTADNSWRSDIQTYVYGLGLLAKLYASSVTVMTAAAVVALYKLILPLTFTFYLYRNIWVSTSYDSVNFLQLGYVVKLCKQ